MPSPQMGMLTQHSIQHLDTMRHARVTQIVELLAGGRYWPAHHRRRRESTGEAADNSISYIGIFVNFFRPIPKQTLKGSCHQATFFSQPILCGNWG